MFKRNNNQKTLRKWLFPRQIRSHEFSVKRPNHNKGISELLYTMKKNYGVATYRSQTSRSLHPKNNLKNSWDVILRTIRREGEKSCFSLSFLILISPIEHTLYRTYTTHYLKESLITKRKFAPTHILWYVRYRQIIFSVIILYKMS